MAVVKRPLTRRHLAVTAAARVRALIQLAEGDDFLREMMISADQTMLASGFVKHPDPVAGSEHLCPTHAQTAPRNACEDTQEIKNKQGHTGRSFVLN